MSFPIRTEPRSVTPFDSSRSEDAIVISRQIIGDPQDFRPPLPKKPRHSDENPPLYSHIPPPPPLPPTNPPLKKSDVFYKTRLCANFTAGSCFNGSRCNFAHGTQDLHKPAPNWQDYVDTEPGNTNEQHRMLRNRICKRFYRGEVCSYGEKCLFLHVEPGKLEEGHVMERGTQPMKGPINHSGKEKMHHSDNFVVGSGKDSAWVQKTRICNKWEETGNCPYGDNCHFAHGHTELKKNVNHMEKFATAPNKALKNDSTGNPSASKHPDKEKRGYSKWNVSTRISSIYADWIDDF